MAVILNWFLLLFELVPVRVLSALGFGFLTVNGYKAAVDSLVSAALDSLNSVSGVAYSMLSLAGLIDAFGIILGAVTAKSALTIIDRLARVTSG